MELKKLMVAVDGSEHSMRAAEYAADLATLGGAHVILVYCRRRLSPILGEPYFQQALETLMEQSTQLMEPFVKMLQKKGVSFTDTVLEGAPGSMIPEAARIEGCDMIVMGSRGLSNLEGLFLGSVTHRVLQSASCPVLVVR